jgi:predicted nucleotidyltransferase
MEKPKDRDFIETIEGLLFCVVGYLHPPDRYTAYLKYVPDVDGRWSREGTRYSRVLPYYHVSQVEKTHGYLRELYPQYIHRCPVRNITVSSVPKGSVERYYVPRERLDSILRDGPTDELEYKLVNLVTILSDLSGLQTRDMGVTGSILTGTQNPAFSDIDLTIYGLKASRSLKETMLEMRGEENVIQPLTSAKKEIWSMRRAARFTMSFEDLMDFADRRWNYGVYRDTYFSIHPVRVGEEITEEYGDYTYTQKGIISGRAVIKDSSEAIYLPAIYRLDEMETGRETASEITDIVSYEGLFCDMFDVGDCVEFRGVLEHVIGVEKHYRVVIGGAGSTPSYMRRVV